MTIPFPLDAFDHADTIRPRLRPPIDKGRIAGIALTVAVHLAVLAGLLTAVHVSRAAPPQELSVAILPDTPKPEENLAPPARLEKPLQVTVPPPEFSIRPQAPSPVVAAPSSPKPVAAAPAARTPVASEGRDSFLNRLLAQLNRYKQYPASARRGRIQGVVMVHFVMDADGRVLTAEIARSSGHQALDDEALALMARAQPLPALPADYPTRTLNAIVPIEFSLDH
jgi:protein TonB